MSEQDSEMAEPEPSSDGAMEELADIVSGKKPAPPAGERNAPRRPARSGRLSKIALILGLVANVVSLPVLCWVGWAVGFGWAENELTEAPVGEVAEVALITAAALVPVCVGVIVSVIALRRAREACRGDTLAMLALLLNLVPVVIGILAVYGGAERVWTHNPNELW
jgi:ABC-type branched-subunit amino acid transport system permease subunit